MNATETVSARKGDWMQTASGKAFWPLDPRPEEVCINDIATALSNECRFGGQIKHHYSVAQHSIYVSHLVPREHALAGLMHDAAEAYCKDIPRPIKQYLTGYAEMEERIWHAIADRFGIDRVLPDCVKVADDAVLLAERDQLLVPSPVRWSVPGEAAAIHITCVLQADAAAVFLRLFHQLTDRRFE